MMLWWRNRLAPVSLAVACLAAMLCFPGSGVVVGLPNLTGGPSVAAPASALIPLALAVTYCYSLSRSNDDVEARAIRPVRVLDIVLAAGCVVPFALGAAVGEHPDQVAALRNTVGYLGLALFGIRFVGVSVAPLVPLVWALSTAMGLIPLNSSVFAWPLSPPLDPASWFVPALVVVTGPVLYLMSPITRLRCNKTWRWPN